MVRYALLFLLLTASVSFSQKVKVACIGNSITEGNMGGAYPVYLQEKLGEEYDVLNAGVSGTTLLKKGDKPYWVYGKLQSVFNFLPDIITIKLGTNDTKPQNWDNFGTFFKDDYNALIDTLNTLKSSPKIFPVLPVPVFKVAWGINNETIDLIIPIIKEIAEERNLTVIDANTPLQDDGNCFSRDGVHPDNEGAEKIADVIFNTLTASTGNIPVVYSKKHLVSKQPHGYITFMKRYNQNSSSLFILNGRYMPDAGKSTKSASVLIAVPR